MERLALPPPIRAQREAINERLPEELIEEILLRLPPDEPECLARAAAVCKRWRTLLRRPAFLRRYRAFHRTPPVLGFFHNDEEDEDTPRALFVPASDAFSRRLFTPFDWYAIDARHGRVLFHTIMEAGDLGVLAVWDPVTGGKWEVRTPFGGGFWNAAVLCAAGGCDHLDCHGRPFSVAYVITDEVGGLSACAYSSVSKAWSERTFVQEPDADANALPDLRPGVLVGGILYFICEQSYILKYDMSGQELAVIEAPFKFEHRCAVLMVAEGGGLGFAGTRGSSIKLWSREEDANGVGRWTWRRVIQLETALHARALRPSPCVAIGFAEGANVIFVRTNVGVFTIELNSGRIKKVSTDWSIEFVIPYMSFQVPG